MWRGPNHGFQAFGSGHGPVAPSLDPSLGLTWRGGGRSVDLERQTVRLAPVVLQVTQVVREACVEEGSLADAVSPVLVLACWSDRHAQVRQVRRCDTIPAGHITM